MKLLIVGALEGYLTKASAIAQSRGCQICHVDATAAAIDMLRGDVSFDLVLVDDKCDFPSFAQELREQRIAATLVACGLGADAKHAVAAIKAGAVEYLPLPPDPEIIAALLESAVEEQSAMIYRSATMAKVVETAAKIAKSDASVLILGESGTGKEILARYIHAASKRKGMPFVAVNCAAIPETLLESELFGHEKGAFSGAVARRLGKFEQANDGTLLLDEISEMDLRLQAKLLRAIQEREIDRLGGSKPVKVHVRILATSNRDMQEVCNSGRFREDLYFRLNVVSLTLPPLRARKDDIVPLAEHFARKYADENAVAHKPFSPKTLEALTQHAWSGNIRELENAVHRAVLLAEGEQIQPETLPFYEQGQNQNTDTDADIGMDIATKTEAKARAPQTGIDDELESKSKSGSRIKGAELNKLAKVERDTVLETLSCAQGNYQQTASILGISIRLLRRKLDRYANEGHVVEHRESSP